MSASKLIAIGTLLFLTSSVCGEQSSRFALLPGNQANLISKMCSRDVPKVEGGWDPAQRDVESLESRLSKISKLKSRGGMIGFQIDEPSRYYRQYVGVLVGGRKLIYLNAFYDEKPPFYCRERLVNIGDGGNAAWGALYDPTCVKSLE